jgi:hypothetical protein
VNFLDTNHLFSQIHVKNVKNMRTTFEIIEQ